MTYLYNISRLAFLILFLFFGRFECLNFSPPTLPDASSSPSPSLAKPLEIIKIHVHAISHAHHMHITCISHADVVYTFTDRRNGEYMYG